MKKIFAFLIILAFFASCTQVMVVQKPKNAPPGQVKKVTGSQSAKPYAPGQQKKKL